METSSESCSTGDDEIHCCGTSSACTCPDLIEDLKEQLEKEERDKITAATLGLGLVQENSELRRHCDDLEGELNAALEANRTLRAQLRSMDHSFFEEEEANTSREEDYKEEIHNLQASLKSAQQDLDRVKTELDIVSSWYEESKEKAEEREEENKKLKENCSKLANKRKKLLRDKSLLLQKNSSLRQQVTELKVSHQNFTQIRRSSQKMLKKGFLGSPPDSSCSCFVDSALPSPISEELNFVFQSTTSSSSPTPRLHYSDEIEVAAEALPCEPILPWQLWNDITVVDSEEEESLPGTSKSRKRRIYARSNESKHWTSSTPHQLIERSRRSSTSVYGGSCCSSMSAHQHLLNRESGTFSEEMEQLKELMRDLKKELEDLRTERLEVEAADHFRRGFSLADELRRAGDDLGGPGRVEYLDLALPHADMAWPADRRKTWRDFFRHPLRFLWDYLVSSFRGLVKKGKLD